MADPSGMDIVETAIGVTYTGVDAQALFGYLSRTQPNSVHMSTSDGGGRSSLSFTYTTFSFSFNFKRFFMTLKTSSWLSLWGRLMDAFFFDSKTTGTSWLEPINTPQSNTAIGEVTFDQLWNNYPSSSISHIDPKTGNDIFPDHCAINLSEALMRSGVDISSFSGVKCWGGCPSGGGHLIRAQELANNLNILFKVTRLTGSNFESYIDGKQGIIFFQNYWQRSGESGRTGDHIDLWNGSYLRDNGALATWFRTTFPGIAELFGLSDLRRSQAVWFWQFK